jgi:hypothetical protein
VRRIANSIDPNVQFTVDVPGNHDSGRIPVLDLEMWIEIEEGGI